MKTYKLSVITSTYKPTFELKAKDMKDAINKSASMLNFPTQKSITIKIEEI